MARCISWLAADCARTAPDMGTIFFHLRVSETAGQIDERRCAPRTWATEKSVSMRASTSMPGQGTPAAHCKACSLWLSPAPCHG